MEHLPSKHEALSSNPSTEKKKKVEKKINRNYLDSEIMGHFWFIFPFLDLKEF
jgi:hypothetical protein